MNTLMQEIQNSIDKSINIFVDRVSKKYNLNHEELLELWGNNTNHTTTQYKPIATAIVKPISASSSNRPSPTKTDSGSSSKGEGCPYIYTKGEKEGETCNIKPKGDVVYCTRHKKYEGTEPKQKKILPSTKKSIAGNTTVKKSPQKKAVNTVLRKNKALDKLWHSATGMVFKSAKERVVVGKCVDDKLLPLTSDDIEVCMAHSFAFEKDSDDVKVPNEEPKAINVSIEHVTINKEAKCIKKSIAAAITETKIQAKDVEEILGKLQMKNFEEKEMFGESDSDSEESEDELIDE